MARPAVVWVYHVHDRHRIAILGPDGQAAEPGLRAELLRQVAQ